MKYKIFRYRKPDLLKDRGEIIGFVAEKDDDEILALQSLLIRESKSALLRRIVYDWVREVAQSKDTMIVGIADYCYNVWKATFNDSRPSKNNDGNMDRFMQELRSDLVSRRLSSETTKEILTKVELLILEDATKN